MFQNIFKKSNNEWKDRYDVALNIAQQEYLLQIDRIKNLDEKIEKFLVVASTFIAAKVAILSSNSIPPLLKHQNSLPLNHYINHLTIIAIIYSFYLSLQAFHNLIKGLRLTETRRMPNTIELIHDSKESSLQWIYSVIEFYEEAKKFLNTAANSKIKHLKKGQNAIQKQTFIFIFILIANFLKIIFTGNQS